MASSDSVAYPRAGTPSDAMPVQLRNLVLTLLVAASFAACDSNSDTVGGIPDATGGDDAEPTGDAADGDDATDAADDLADALDASEPEDVATDVPDARVERDAEEPECEFSTDCPPDNECVDGACIQRCVQDSECDDLNVCTTNACEDGLCTRTVIEPAPLVGDAVAGDCRREVCIDGALEVVPEREDRPEDDGIFCTVESCAGSFPRHDPNDDLCDDGVAENGGEFCSVAERGCQLGDRPPWFCEPALPGWGPEEICGDGQDNDGNGLVDEGCPCEFGNAARCYAGPPSTRDVGGCLDGYMRCVDRDDPHWGECEGQITPREEICDLKDNNCNGCVDDIEDCDPLLTCPTEDFARPLRNYALDASAIFDFTDTRIDRVSWRVIAPANSGTTGVDDPDAVATSVYLDVSGDYQISLSLETDKGTFGCSWVVHAAGSGLRVEMRWDTFGAVDMDLHLHRSGSTRGFCSDDDCYFANCQTSRGGGPEWGYPDSPPTECGDGTASCNNPRLDIDNIRGYDPENINIDNPRDGDTFRVMAHMYSGGGNRTNPVLSIYCGGRLRAVLGEAPDEAGLTESSGGCNGQTWRVADVAMIVDSDTGVTDCSIDVLTDADGSWDIRTDDRSY